MKYVAIALSTLIAGGLSFNQSTLAETLIQTQGRLDNRDEQLNDDSFYETHTFNGQAGQQVSIQLTSSDFDTYLMLIDPDGQKIAENDDAQNSTNSAITVTLPSSGTYTVIANSYDNSSGAYSMVVSSDAANSVPPRSTPAPLITIQSDEPSATSCRGAISNVEEALAKGGYYIPWDTELPYRPRVTPAVFVEDDGISNNYYGYPADRLQSVSFRLSGDSDKLYQGIMNSPQLLATYTSQITSACPQVGLVNFQHWWEGVVPMGLFSDGSTRQFEWVDLEPGDTVPDGRRIRTVQTADGPRTLFPWGYYYSP